MGTERLFILVSTFLSLALAWFFFSLTPVAGGSVYAPVEIISGDGFTEIAAALSDKRIIRSKSAFMVYGAFSGAAHRIKPGNYILSAGSSTPTIINILSKGPAIDVKITIPEGATVKDIDNVLSVAGVLPPGAIANYGGADLEGYLFPDTYRFFKNSQTEEVINKFIDNFNKKTKLLLGECRAMDVGCRESIIIASLLEKEAPDFEDRRVIAGVLDNRLRIGMPLQIDATLVYAKCGGKFLTCENPKVLKSDIKIESYYNTYLYNGLPPGPIGNPGLEAIRAALNPAKTSYFYYLSDPNTKKTIFSETLDEHNDNRARYLGI